MNDTHSHTVRASDPLAGVDLSEYVNPTQVQDGGLTQTHLVRGSG
ncbi:hypothetical protein ABH939_006624 [Rhodococcus sp. 27YEA6]